MLLLISATLITIKPGFHMLGKSQTFGDSTFVFADHPRFCLYIGYSPEVCTRISRDATFNCDRGTGAQQLRELEMSEVHRRLTPTSPTVQIVGNERKPQRQRG